MKSFFHILWSTVFVALVGTFIQINTAHAEQTRDDRFVVLDVEVVFQNSKFGKAAAEVLAEARKDQLSENAELILALSKEEQALTKQRQSMTHEDFQPLAEDFDQKVRALRLAQDDKSKAVEQAFEDKRLEFFNALPKVLDAVLESRNAQAVLDRRVLLYARQIFDVTDDVIVAVDDAYEAGNFGSERAQNPKTPIDRIPSQE